MTEHVTVQLTRYEAEALLSAAGYALEWPAIIEVFGERKDGDVLDKNQCNAAARAVAKILRAGHRTRHACGVQYALPAHSTVKDQPLADIFRPAYPALQSLTADADENGLETCEKPQREAIGSFEQPRIILETTSQAHGEFRLHSPDGSSRRAPTPSTPKSFSVETQASFDGAPFGRLWLHRRHPLAREA